MLWEIRNFTETIARMVYDGHLISGYEHRYVIDESTYDLTIRNSQLRDTGEYSCVEDEGFGTKHVTKLYVTGRLLYSFGFPLLWSPYVIGQTIIFLPCDFYLLSSIFYLLSFFLA